MLGFALLVFLPASGYFLVFEPAWSYLYTVEGARRFAALNFAALGATISSVPLGFLIAVPARPHEASCIAGSARRGPPRARAHRGAGGREATRSSGHLCAISRRLRRRTSGRELARLGRDVVRTGDFGGRDLHSSFDPTARTRRVSREQSMQRSSDNLTELAGRVVERARKAGADVAEASARGGFELSVRVRLGKPELVEEAGHHSVSLRVLKNQRVAITSTSDLSDAGIERCVEDALSLVELSEPDPFAGPADPSLLCSPPHPDLELFDPSVGSIDAEQAIAIATGAEAAALGFDPRITLSEGASFSRTDGVSALVLSSGFSGLLHGSYASLSVAPVAEDDGGKKRRGHYWTGHRHFALMEDAEAVGKEAARRTVGKLGARKIATTEAPIVFDPDVARSIVGSFAGCILGGSLFRRASYLLEREGRRSRRRASTSSTIP